MTNVLPRRRTLRAGIVAGAIAGVLMLVCLVAMHALVLRTPGFTLAGLFAFDASTLVGRAAYGADSYAALGAALHFLVAIGWAVGYAVLAQRERQLRARPLISGAAFGLIIYFAMQLVLVAANLYRIPTPAELGVDLLAHIAFYGIPVALLVARFAPPE